MKHMIRVLICAAITSLGLFAATNANAWYGGWGGYGPGCGWGGPGITVNLPVGGGGYYTGYGRGYYGGCYTRCNQWGNCWRNCY